MKPKHIHKSTSINACKDLQIDDSAAVVVVFVEERVV